jgi:hypothetical protein
VAFVTPVAHCVAAVIEHAPSVLGGSTPNTTGERLET